MPLPNLATLTERYLFTGRLVMESGLHVGGGRDTLTTTNSPVMKFIDDRPFIPGSSMKGAFRSAVERIAGALPSVRSCGLLADNDVDCPTQDENKVKKATSAADAWLEAICETCGLFGSPFMSGKTRFSDLNVIHETWPGVTEIRDGVGIDRDSGCAVDRIKYDFEVVPSETEFQFQLVVENPEAERHELGLIGVGLREFQSGMIPIGGIRTRGLGRCRLVDLRAYKLDFNQPQQFKAYLKKGSLEVADLQQDAQSLLDNAIDTLFA